MNSLRNFRSHPVLRILASFVRRAVQRLHRRRRVAKETTTGEISLGRQGRRSWMGSDRNVQRQTAAMYERVSTSVVLNSARPQRFRLAHDFDRLPVNGRLPPRRIVPSKNGTLASGGPTLNPWLPLGDDYLWSTTTVDVRHLLGLLRRLASAIELPRCQEAHARNS